MTHNFTKVIHPYDIKFEWQKRSMPVFIKIEFKNDRLSITGVEGPLPSGNCRGGAGQIRIDGDETHFSITRYSHGWNETTVKALMDIWKKWHLNDMHAECIHQEEKGIKYNDDPKNVCDVCGYKIGSGWTFRDVPESVLNWLIWLPDTDRQPAWV